MKRVLGPALVAALAAFLLAQANEIKPAAFAGQFYEKDPSLLGSELDHWLAGVKPEAPTSGKILALIAPHAGYEFSAQTAAYAYAAVRGKAYETVVIIGPSHRIGFDGCSIWPRGGFETPLGVVKVDEAMARAIGRASGFGFFPGAFAEEHSVEVEIPFVQKVLPEARIVPIVMGLQTKPTIQALANGLIKACAGKSVLVVASTDMSHYLSEAKADKVDAETVALLESFKPETLIRKVEAGENILCGGGPVAAAMLYAQRCGPVRLQLLKHSNSAESGTPPDRTVGYMAAAVVLNEEKVGETFALTFEEKAVLLRLARSAVVEFVSRGAVVAADAGNPKFLLPRGVFVTIKKKGELRGCIGYIQAVAPLAQAVVETAIYAATQDPRFPRVGQDELKDLAYEVSVLTPLKEITAVRTIDVGRHGLYIERGGRTGLLLPQVAVENGWDRETFLAEVCVKAGLPPDAWKAGARISVFEAIVFHE